MPSPNLYFDCEPPVELSRNAARVIVSHDTNAAPWNPATAGSYTWVVETGLSATGPWVAADYVSAGDECSDEPDTPFVPGGVLQSQAGIAGLTEDTDYWFRWTLFDDSNTQVDQHVCPEAGPYHTPAKPTPAQLTCLTSQITETTARLQYGGSGGVLNTSDPCNVDQITWEWGTTAGGPYPNSSGPADPTGNSPFLNVTGLTASTDYYYRATLDWSDGGSMTTNECTFQTAAPNAAPTITGVDNQTGPVGTQQCDTFTVADSDGTIASVTVAPAGPVLTDMGGGTWQICHTPAAVGTENFTITVTDDDAATADAPISFTGEAAANLPPTITGVDNQTGPVGVQQCDTFSVADSDGTIASVTVAPAGPTLTDQGGGTWQICHTPAAAGTEAFTITVTDDDAATATAPITFTGTDAVVPPGTTPARPLIPADCAAGESGPDTEQLILCDKDENGDILGTAVMVTNYEGGVATGPPMPFDPATGDPYVVQGTLSPCEQCQPAEPKTFFFTSSTTGPVDFPGRSYTGTLDISRGYRVDQLSIGGTNFPVSILWSILDTEGTDFAEDLRAAIQQRIPGSTVTVTPPPIDRCDTDNRPFLITIDCIDQDQAPNDVTIRYDSGTDLVQNPAQLADDGQPAVGPGGLGFQLRQDDDGTYQPQAPHTLDCTAIDGEGWYITPQARFETWGAGFLNTTPTPRGGSIIELNTTTGTPEILHQRVVVPVDGVYTLRAQLGGRSSPVSWNLRLSTGDTGAAGAGDIANITQVTPPVGDTPNPQPWSTLEQLSIPLTAGIYTLSMSGTGGQGALFTDLRLFTQVPNTIQSLTANDECINTRDVTTNTVDCQDWIPQYDGNCEIVAWQRLDTGEIQTQAAFFAQVPAPVGCYIAPEGEAPEVTFGNLIHTYTICAAGRNLQRTLITDNSGAAVSESFTDENGTQVGAPANYTIGACPGGVPDVELTLVCADGEPVLREAVYSNGFLQSSQFLGANGAVITPDPAAWTPGPCPDTSSLDDESACDIQPDGSAVEYWRRTTVDEDGVVTVTTVDAAGAPYTLTGTAGPCPNPTVGWESICYRTVADGPILPGTKRHDDRFPAPGFLVFDADGNPVNTAAAGYEQVVCAPECCDEVIDTGCWVDGANSGRYTSIRSADGTVQAIDTVTGDPLPATATVDDCPDAWLEQEVLCDDNGPFVRTYQFSGATLTGTTDLTLAGVAYAPVGTVGSCTADGSQRVEEETVCADLGQGVPAPVMRRVTIDAAGVESVAYLVGQGANTVDVTGAVQGWSAGACDNEYEVLCDANGVPFRMRHHPPTASNPSGLSFFTLGGNPINPAPTEPYQNCAAEGTSEHEVVCFTTTAGGDEVFTGSLRFDATLTGPATPGWELLDQHQTPVAGDEPGLEFVDCSTCCPQVIGRGCIDGGGEWVSIRNGDGTTEVVNVGTGDPVPPGDVLAECPRPTYTTTVSTVGASATDTTAPNTDLVSWSVRAIAGQVTLTVNGGTPQAMTVGEVISSSAHDNDGTLSDSVTVETAAGSSARVVILRRD